MQYCKGEIVHSVSEFRFLLQSTLWTYVTPLSNGIAYGGGTQTLPLCVSCSVCDRHYIKYMLNKIILETGRYYLRK